MKNIKFITVQELLLKVLSVFTVTTFMLIVSLNVFAAPPSDDCEVSKDNGCEYTTTISSVILTGGVYTIVLTVEADEDDDCSALSHYSVEALPGTYSNISVDVISGGMTYGDINYGPNLGSDPFDGFKIDDIEGIGNEDEGEFTITYTITSLQDQRTSAKAGQSSNIASFTEEDFLFVLNCENDEDPPEAVNDYETTPYNTAVDIDALDNDIEGDAALDPTSVTFIPGTEPNPTTDGVFTVNETTGLVTFTPVNGFVGTVTINYEVCDLNSLCDIATIVVLINPPLTGPTAYDDSEVTPLNTPVDIEALDNDVAGDADLDPTSVSFIGGTEPNPATEGLFTVNGTTGLVTFTPFTGFTGTVTIDYEVCDLNNLCDIATITVIISTDTDGDGCPDDVDDYPEDPTRCFDIYYPANGNGTLAYEDLWPSKGDYDFNDLVIEYRFKTVTSGTNHIVETFADFTIKAFGAGYENGFGFQLANDNIADADILSVTGYDLQEAYVSLGTNGIEEGQSIPTIIVYDNAFNIMEHPGMGIGVNTEPWAPYVAPVTLNIYISYKQSTYTYAQLDIPNFNPFIMVNLNRGTEVHLPNYDPTDLANEWQFGTWDDDSDASTGRYYKTVSNLPWAIHIPEPFEWPIEKQDIIWVHLKFAEWAESGGTLFQDWYKDLPGYRDNSLIYDNQP